jgi:hypothetical protein
MNIGFTREDKVVNSKAKEVGNGDPELGHWAQSTPNHIRLSAGHSRGQDRGHSSSVGSHCAEGWHLASPAQQPDRLAMSQNVVPTVMTADAEFQVWISTVTGPLKARRL